jgi:voltage-gated potassium channel
MEPNTKEKLTPLNLIILILTIYVLLALLIDTFFNLPDELSKLLGIIDNIICILFIFDFFVRFFKANNKLDFLKWGWIDLISSIPTIAVLRYGRFVRLIRLVRLLRALRSTNKILTHVFKNRAQGTFTSVAIFAILIVVFSSIGILLVENDANSNIKTAEDAIWWAYVTVTTVGYGDKFPVTTEGRFIAIILMSTGVGLFGTFSGFIASWFVKDKR